jgi:hypothetical protein
MNKVILLLPFLLFSMMLNGQRVEKQKLEFSYIQFPTTPVKDVNSYNSTLIIGYQSKIDKMKSDYQEQEAKAESDYQVALTTYNVEKKKADDQYNENVKQYQLNEQIAQAEYQAALKIYQQGSGANSKGDIGGGTTGGGAKPNAGGGTTGGGAKPNAGGGTTGGGAKPNAGGGTTGGGAKPNAGGGTTGGGAKPNAGGGTTGGGAKPNAGGGTTGGGAKPNAGGGTTGGGAKPNAGSGTTGGGANSKVGTGTVNKGDTSRTAPVKRIVTKPVRRNVEMPVKTRIVAPYYPKMFNEKTLADSYLILEGMTKESNNALQIIATLKGFDLISREVKERKKSSKNKAGETIVTKSYLGYVSYKHPIHIQVITPMGQTLMDEILTNSDKTRSSKTKEFRTREEAEQYLNQGGFLSNIEDNTMTKNMEGIKGDLNNRFGFPIKKRKTFFRIYSHRKMKYTEYREAYESIVRGYKIMVDRKNRAEVIGHVNEAITAWERAVKESDLTSKKARINKKVTRFTHLMLAEAYMWVDNFIKAEEHLTRMQTLKPVMKEKKWMTRLIKLVASQKQRITAYNNAQ